MVNFGDVRMVKRPIYPSLLICLMFLMLISSCITKSKGSSNGVPNSQFFKTTRPRMSHKYLYGGAAVNGFLPKALPIPPSGPSHHHNSVGVNTMHP
ncbi:hypothetical protein R6Q59_025454 [Mikania micrantha]